MWYTATSKFCLMLFTSVSQLAQVEYKDILCLLTLSDSTLFSHPPFSLLLSSTLCFPSPLSSHYFRIAPTSRWKCVQVCTYSGHRDGVWQVSHARNGLPVIGSASAGTLVEWHNEYFCSMQNTVDQTQHCEVLYISSTSLFACKPYYLYLSIIQVQRFGC